MRRTRVAIAAVVLGLLAASAAAPAQAAAPETTTTVTAATAAGIATPAPTSVAAADTPLSAIGEAAIADVRTCLSSGGERRALDVYYLVDASGSLFSEIDGDDATDPDKKRADILANSLRQLAQLPATAVSYSVGFFGSTFKPGSPWAAVAPASADSQADAMASLIQNQGPLGATNWAAGIAGAQDALSTQSASSNGCQMLVWLTDGAIDLGTDQASDDALNDLCGEQIMASGHAPADGNGAFNALRQQQVVVVGVLLNARPPAAGSAAAQRVAAMQPLVESESADGSLTCAQHPIPDDYASGLYLAATDPSSLASVFLQLGAQLAGGQESEFDADGGFEIDRGVAQFIITTSQADWTLTAPDGTKHAASDDSSDAVAISNPSGVATQVTVTVDPASDTGRWVWGPSTDGTDLYLLSGLVVTFDEANAIVRGQDATVRGSIVRTDGSQVDLADYDSELTVTTGSGADASATVVQPAADGTFETTVPAEADGDGTSLAVRADLTLKTAEHGLALAPLSAEQSVSVALPDAFPTVTANDDWTTLTGTDGSAAGTVFVNGPKAGDGTLCFPQPFAAASVDDSTDRSAGWTFTADAEPGTRIDADGCLAVAQGQSITVTLTAANPVAADSAVTATFDFESRDASGASLPLSVPVSFTSTKEFSVALFGGLILLLVLLGILLPLALLWVLNLATSRILHGDGLLRAEFPVVVSADGIAGRGIDLRSAEIGTDQFAFQANAKDARRFPDRRLGALRARTPWNPFGQPWFEIVARDGERVFAPDAASGARGAATPSSSHGRVTPFAGSLPRLWAVTVSENELRGATAETGVPGTLVVYSRSEPLNPAAFSERMKTVLGAAPLWPRIAAARDALAESDAAADRAAAARAGEKASGSPASSAAATPASSDVPPPPTRRSASGETPPPPPTRGSASGTPPRRGSDPGTPPPRSTHGSHPGPGPGPGTSPGTGPGSTPPPPPRRRP